MNPYSEQRVTRVPYLLGDSMKQNRHKSRARTRRLWGSKRPPSLPQKPTGKGWPLCFGVIFKSRAGNRQLFAFKRPHPSQKPTGEGWAPPVPVGGESRVRFEHKTSSISSPTLENYTEAKWPQTASRLLLVCCLSNRRGTPSPFFSYTPHGNKTWDTSLTFA